MAVQQTYQDLADVFSNVGASLNTAYALSAPVQEMFWVLASTSTVGLALIGLGIATLGRSFGANMSVGEVIRAIGIAAVFAIGTDSSLHLNPEYNDARRVAEERVGDATSYGMYVNQPDTIPHNAPSHTVSLALTYIHKISTYTLQMVMAFVDKFLSPDNQVTAGENVVPTFVFTAFNGTMATVFDDAPAFKSAYVDYVQACTSQAAKTVNIDPQELAKQNVDLTAHPSGGKPIDIEEWRAVGLFGGYRLGLHTKAGQGGIFDRFMQNAQNLVVYLTGGGGLTVDTDPPSATAPNALKAMEQMDLITPGTVVRGQNGYKIYTKDFWRSRLDPEFHLSGSQRYVPNSGFPQDIQQHPYSPRSNDGHTVFPTTCREMYEVVDRGFYEYRQGTADYLGTHTETAYYTEDAVAVNAMAMTANATRVLLEDKAMFGSSDWNLAHAGIAGAVVENARGAIEGVGGELSTWWQKLDLQTAVPATFGTVLFIYFILLALFPLHLMFAVLPGRSGSIGFHLKLIFVCFVTLILMYIFIRIGAVLLQGIAEQLAMANLNGGHAMAAKIAPWAYVYESGMMGLILLSPVIAKMVVFSSEQMVPNIGRPMSSGRATKAAATAAGVAAGGARIGAKALHAGVNGSAASLSGAQAAKISPAITRTTGIIDRHGIKRTVTRSGTPSAVGVSIEQLAREKALPATTYAGVPNRGKISPAGGGNATASDQSGASSDKPISGGAFQSSASKSNGKNPYTGGSQGGRS